MGNYSYILLSKLCNVIIWVIVIKLKYNNLPNDDKKFSLKGQYRHYGFNFIWSYNSNIHIYNAFYVLRPQLISLYLPPEGNLFGSHSSGRR